MTKKVLSFGQTLSFSFINTFKFFFQFLLVNLVGFMIMFIGFAPLGYVLMPSIQQWQQTGIFAPAYSSMSVVLASIFGIICFICGAVLYNAMTARLACAIYDKKRVSISHLFSYALTIFKPLLGVSLYVAGLMLAILFFIISPGVFLAAFGIGALLKSAGIWLFVYFLLALVGVVLSVIGITLMFTFIIRIMFSQYVVVDQGVTRVREALEKSSALIKGHGIRLFLYIMFVGILSNVVNQLSIVRLFVTLPPNVNFSFLSLLLLTPFSVLLFVYTYKRLKEQA